MPYLDTSLNQLECIIEVQIDINHYGYSIQNSDDHLLNLDTKVDIPKETLKEDCLYC